MESNMTTPSFLLSAEQSLLVVIDVQERLVPVIQGWEKLTASIRFLMDAAAILTVPVIVTEQYPKGLGPTVELIRNHPATILTLEKLRFSAAETLISNAWGAEQATRMARPIPEQIVLVGIESHVCVQQTALELRDEGLNVFVAADCIGSRHAEDHDAALRRMAAAGVTVTTAESIAFEWCGEAGSDRFKTLSRLVRDRDSQLANQPGE